MGRISTWAILLVVAALLLLAAPVGAFDYEETFSYSNSDSWSSGETAYALVAGSDSTIVKTLFTNDAASLSGLYRYIFFSKYPAHTVQGGWFSTYLPLPTYAASPITIKSGSTVIGTGEITFTQQYDMDNNPVCYVYVIDLDSWDTGSLTGRQVFTMYVDSAFPFAAIMSCEVSKVVSEPEGIFYAYYTTSGGASAKMVRGTHEAYYRDEWSNTLSASSTDDNVYISLDKGGYKSKIIISGSTYTYSSLYDDQDVSIDYPLVNLPLDVAVYAPSGDWYNRTVTALGVGGDAGKGSSDYFTLSLSPSSAAVGDEITSTLSPSADAPAYDMVEWTLADDWRPYRLTTGTWYAYNATTETYADAVTEADVLSQTCQFTLEGNGPVFCRVYDLANGTLLADLKKYVAVSGTSALKFPLYVAVFDADSGATLMSTSCQITDLDTSEVTTTTIQTSRAGETFLLDSSDRYQIVVSKTGYESRTWTNIRSDTSSLTAYLPKTAGGPTDIYIYFSVHDTGGAPVQNALVSLTGLTPTLTNAQGSVKLLAATNTTYTYSVSADGYIGATDSLETSATSLWYECTLTPTGGAATATTTATVPGGSSENLDDAMVVWTDNLQLIAALLFMAFIIGILKLMV